MEQILLFSFLPVLAALFGASLTAVRPPGARLRSAVQHFAAGVVFSVVAVELMPDIMREHKPLPVILGFVLGISVMLVIRSLTRGAEQHESNAGRALPAALLIATGVDVLIDGFLIGIGFAAGAKEGKLLAIAITIELLSLGLATAVALKESGVGRFRTVVTTTGIALLIVVGAALGGTVLRTLSGSAMETVLSFGLAALLFLVTEELLVEAHEVPETPWITGCFFAGFLLFVVLGMLEAVR